jgi:hypothetical protein
LTALISLTMASACSTVIGDILLSYSDIVNSHIDSIERTWRRAKVSASSLKSIFVPTNNFGVDGQWWAISGFHFARTFSKDGGETTEKQIKKTSVCG